MEIHCICGHDYDSNIYIIKGEIPTVIDCGTGLYNKEVVRDIKKIIDPSLIKQIILTHEHFDHCGGVKKIYEITNNKAQVIAHEYATEKIERGESYFARMLGGVMPKMHVDVKLKDGDSLTIGNELFKVIHTPGHTPGCICLYSKVSKSLISGDTVFSLGSFGRYDLPSGDANLLKKSIELLAKLDIVNLYPGHESFIEGNANEHLALSLKNSRYLM